MQLPANIQNVINQFFHETSLSELGKASERLTSRYRAELRDGQMHLNSKIAALAYMAARFPATFATVTAALKFTLEIMPDFSPKSQLDVGAGPATALLAASEVFPSIEQATLVEQSDEIMEVGKNLASQVLEFSPVWKNANIKDIAILDLEKADLVTLSYVLDELESVTRNKLVDELWTKAGSVLVLIEPGTPAGWQRLMEQRDRLLAQGAFLVAPCPHALKCPIQEPNWCHFSQRVERTRTHRMTKQAEVPFEDEKYFYISLSKNEVNNHYFRVISQPRKSSGKINLNICLPNGQYNNEIVTKKNKELYIRARKTLWGSTV